MRRRGPSLQMVQGGGGGWGRQAGRTAGLQPCWLAVDKVLILLQPDRPLEYELLPPRGGGKQRTTRPRDGPRRGGGGGTQRATAGPCGRRGGRPAPFSSPPPPPPPPPRAPSRAAQPRASSVPRPAARSGAGAPRGARGPPAARRHGTRRANEPPRPRRPPALLLLRRGEAAARRARAGADRARRGRRVCAAGRRWPRARSLATSTSATDGRAAHLVPVSREAAGAVVEVDLDVRGHDVRAAALVQQALPHVRLQRAAIQVAEHKLNRCEAHTHARSGSAAAAARSGVAGRRATHAAASAWARHAPAKKLDLPEPLAPTDKREPGTSGRSATLGSRRADRVLVRWRRHR